MKPRGGQRGGIIFPRLEHGNVSLNQAPAALEALGLGTKLQLQRAGAQRWYFHVSGESNLLSPSEIILPRAP